MNQQEQLTSLRRPASPAGSGARKNLGSLLLLLAFIVGVALVFVLIFGSRLLPRVPVTVVSAQLLESDAAVPVAAAGRLGSALAQASGWVEPDPFPVRVPVKVDGFVESMLVYEGDTVKRGQLLATLDATNHTLRVEQLAASLTEARALHRVREQEVEQALRDRTVAASEQQSAVARYDQAADRLRRIRSLEPGDLPDVDVVEAGRAETDSRAAVDAADARRIRADAVVESRRAEQARQDARVTALEAELEQASVDLARTRIVAPMDGRVLKRFAVPGSKRMAGMDDPDSATIVLLYDPERLQVRVDVPLSDSGRLTTGMPARVVTAGMAGQTLTGHVTRITGQADITRNTLQVKVALQDPDPRLRPEMLCRVEFFAPPSRGAATGARARQTWLSEAALADGVEGPATVWVVDPVSETVSSRAIDVGTEARDGLRIVYAGLRPGEQVVVDNQDRLTPGARVVVREESP